MISNNTVTGIATMEKDCEDLYIIRGQFGLQKWQENLMYPRSQQEDDMLDGRQYEDEEVVSPNHYTVGGMEALEVIKAKLTLEEYRGYCKGNALKYLMRANYKGKHNQDCEKAEYYIQELCNANDEATVPNTNAIKVRADYSSSPPF